MTAVRIIRKKFYYCIPFVHCVLYCLSHLRVCVYMCARSVYVFVALFWTVLWPDLLRAAQCIIGQYCGLIS